MLDVEDPQRESRGVACDVTGIVRPSAQAINRGANEATAANAIQILLARLRYQIGVGHFEVADVRTPLLEHIIEHQTGGETDSSFEPQRYNEPLRGYPEVAEACV